MSFMRKLQNAKTAQTKAAVATPAEKPVTVTPVITTKPAAKPVKQTKSVKQVKAVTPVTVQPAVAVDDKAALAKVFASVAPKLRNVFQAKFTKLDLTKHTSAKPSDRDEAFIKAIRVVYGTKPFTHKQTGADTGNMARSIHIGYIKATGKTDANGEALYSAVSNKATV